MVGEALGLLFESLKEKVVCGYFGALVGHVKA
jgi:hypothetical protein